MSDASVVAAAPLRRLIAGVRHVMRGVVVRLGAQAELATMDDRTLADLGLSRGDIASVARAHAAAY